MFFVKINYFYKTRIRIKSIQLNTSNVFMNNYYQLLITDDNWKVTVNQRVSGSSPEGGALLAEGADFDICPFPFSTNPLLTLSKSSIAGVNLRV